MASKLPPNSLPVRGRTPGVLERVPGKRWRQLERVVQALRSIGETPMTQARAERLAQRFGVHWATIYRYRAWVVEIDEATAIAGRTRGWKPLASRLSVKQEQSIEEAINALPKWPRPLRVVDLVEEVGARCRLFRVPYPSNPAIDRRLKCSPALKVHRRGVAAPGTADPRICPGSFVVQRPLDFVQIDHTPMDIVVVDDLYRQPLGKPYLTFATVVITRCSLGFVVSLAPPGAGAASLSMTFTVSPKAAWRKQLGVARD